MEREKIDPFRVITKLNYIRLMIFFILVSLADKKGVIHLSMLRVHALLKGTGSNRERPISLTPTEFREQLKRLAYQGILVQRGSAQENIKAGTIMYREPLQLNGKYIHFIPKTLLTNIESDRVVRLKLDKQDLIKRKKELNEIVAKLREEVRLAKTIFIPVFKMDNQDGTINKRSVEFRKLWAWFILLGIERAFETIKYKNSDPDNPIKDLDYQLMAVWISKYGLANIEGLFAKFYENRRLQDLMEEAGDKWPGVVKRFIWGSLKNINRDVDNKQNNGIQYEPRKKVIDPGAGHGDQIEM